MTRPIREGEAAPRPGPRPGGGDLDDALRRRGFTVGAWRVEPRLNRIVSGHARRAVDPRLMDVLVSLAARPGEVLTRDEILDAAWRGTFVGENTLSQAISRLRKALGDDPAQPRYIETISKSGYRLIAPVQWPDGSRGLRALEVEPSSISAPPDRNAGAEGHHAPAAASTEVVSRRSAGLTWMLSAGLVVSLVVLLWLTRRPSTTGSADGSTLPWVRPEVTLAGNQFEPRLSPDGRRVAFAWRESETTSFDIWVKTVGGDSPVRLTRHEHQERIPVWSPDGTSIAFVRFSETDRVCGIFTIPVLGDQAVHLAPCPERIRSMDWSPGGRTLAVDGLTDGGRTRALFLLDIESGERRQLTHPPEGIPGDTGARFSPDGTMLVFERVHGPFLDIAMLIPVAGGEDRALTADRSGQIRGVDWRSDGEAVFFSSNRAGQFILWQAAVSGGDPVQIPILDTWVTQPSVARSGGRMLYRTFRDSVDLWELPLDSRGRVAGEPSTRLDSSRSERHPAWSPDGENIAFVSDRNGSNEVWSGRLDGTHLVRHTDLTGATPGSPEWSPDNRHILYHAAVEGHADLWIVDRDSRRPRRVTTEVSEDRNGTFSSDGRRIYFASDRGGHWDIWRIPAEGGQATPMGTETGFLARESVDGRHLYYVRIDRPGIWRMSVDGGGAEPVIASIDLSDWGNWVVGDKGIYYVRRGPTAIALMAFGSTKPTAIYTPPRQIPYLGRALSLSPDGRSLLFSMIDHGDDELMTVDLAGL